MNNSFIVLLFNALYLVYIFIHDIDVIDFEKPVLESNKVVIVIINEKHWAVFRLQVLQDDNFFFGETELGKIL